jgi:dihydrofolate synthase/folylpolyglutamate synthase
MTYSESIDFLYKLRFFGAKFGLENTLKLAGQAGSPQHRLRFIHVAGTNGKGSTCAMLDSIYRKAGLRVGLFTSPHLVAFGERIQVNREPVSEAQIIRLVGEMRAMLDEPIWHASESTPGQGVESKEPYWGHPTFFEVVTVMAVKYFEEQHCDLVVWETGLGGRLDATNIVTPLASVITNVQYDHQQWLGDTLEKIASEKAGIIKPGIPVLTAAQAPEALEVIRQTAESQKAPLSIVAPEELDAPGLKAVRLALRGDHQRLNAALAVRTVRQLQTLLPVSESDIISGLEDVDWPGRFQLERTTEGRMFLLDGAHNCAGVETLRAALLKYFPQTRPALILGILKDKDWRSMCRVLAPLASRVLLVPVHSERSASTEDMRAVCEEANPQAAVQLCPDLRAALERTDSEPFVGICGSLYLIGEAMELLGLGGERTLGERGLNEWSAGPASR